MISTAEPMTEICSTHSWATRKRRFLCAVHGMTRQWWTRHYNFLPNILRLISCFGVLGQYFARYIWVERHFSKLLSTADGWLMATVERRKQLVTRRAVFPNLNLYPRMCIYNVWQQDCQVNILYKARGFPRFWSVFLCGLYRHVWIFFCVSLSYSYWMKFPVGYLQNICRILIYLLSEPSLGTVMLLTVHTTSLVILKSRCSYIYHHFNSNSEFKKSWLPLWQIDISKAYI